MSKQIPLTKGKFATVDDDDFSELSRFKWQAIFMRCGWYASRSHIKDGVKTRMLMHRHIMEPEDAVLIDHWDGNGLNNQRGNLRPCTHSQNHFNTAPPSNNKSGVKGVSWSNERGRWVSRITIRGKVMPLGRFLTFEEAVAARKEAEAKHHGEFAYAG